MKKILFATLSLFALGSYLPSYSATFTHNLEYTTKPGDNSGSLSGQVTFDSNFGSAQNFMGSGFNTVPINRSLITNVTFTYTADGEEPLTIVNDEITEFRLQHASLGSTDYAAADIKGEFTTLQFFSESGAFVLSVNDGTFGLQAAADDDYTLTRGVYHSPGPLPFLGLFTAFSYIKKLKSRYKDKFS